MTRPTRLALVLAGIVFGQFVLYGPSLLGRKVLLPLDLLTVPKFYLPQTPEVSKITPDNKSLPDLIFLCEPARRFAVSELHAGRLPMWAPYQFAGVPFIWPKFSPFMALRFAIASPVVLAWSQLLAAIVAGLGAYLFCRAVLAVSFWPAAIAGWCYPLTGFFVFWQGFPTGLAVHWLPWILLAVDKTVRGRSALAPVGLSLVTGLVLVSGHLDVAGQVLLVSGLYAVWGLGCILMLPLENRCSSAREGSDGRSAGPARQGPSELAQPAQAGSRPALTASGWGAPQRRRAMRAVLALTAGWGLGFLLAAPYLLPTAEYVRTGARMVRRSAGQEERPPFGVGALPETVLPDVYGTDRVGSFRYSGDIQIESAAAAYTGLLATLVVAPLAWRSQRHRVSNLFWVLLGFGGLCWCLDIPGVVDLLRLPGINMFSHNRLTLRPPSASSL
ncbi:MAG TPA: hypothetical protein VMU04_07090 [Candidatus Acidoferrum sp.]|nr:hypothetical protein [Candidatus Acidoferrum sp.]